MEKASEDGTLTKGTEYTITTPPSQTGKTGFKLQFSNDINSAYKIVYKTKS
ncbi:collagen binding domain-containing protein [Paenibacillus rhizoplanae]